MKKFLLAGLFGMATTMTLFQNFAPTPVVSNRTTSSSGAKPCSLTKIQDILEVGAVYDKGVKKYIAAEDPYVVLDCSLNLNPNDVITKRLVIEGSEASGVTLDCNGATLQEILYQDQIDSVVQIRSVLPEGSSTWQRPENITIKNCKTSGRMHVYGMARGAAGPHIWDSSRKPGHTERVQASAPRNINFNGIHFDGARSTIYIGAGVTSSSIINSTFNGSSAASVIYLDAESAGNVIRGNTFNSKPSPLSKREIIAIDGSANNKIIGNTFNYLPYGGVKIYRNCGEDGVIRHQAPIGNVIINNFFNYESLSEEERRMLILRQSPAIWVGSRNERTAAMIRGEGYCHLDEGFSFGSSIDNYDNARGNAIFQNQVSPSALPVFIKDSQGGNHIFYNRRVVQQEIQLPGCYIAGGYPSPFLAHNKSLSLKTSAYGPVCNGTKYTCNEGNVLRSQGPCPSDAAQSINFRCVRSNDNRGCQSTFSCPEGKRIVDVRAACDLEDGTVADSEFNSTRFGQLSVTTPSHLISHGACSINGRTLSSGEINLNYLKGETTIEFGCHERDTNGGDCEVRGQVICL